MGHANQEGPQIKEHDATCARMPQESLCGRLLDQRKTGTEFADGRSYMLLLWWL